MSPEERTRRERAWAELLERLDREAARKRITRRWARQHPGSQNPKLPIVEYKQRGGSAVRADSPATSRTTRR